MPRQRNAGPKKHRDVIFAIGPSICYAPLTRNQFALLDSWNGEKIGQHNWCASWSEKLQGFYAMRGQTKRTEDGTKKTTTFGMHREILGVTHGDLRKIDHQNRNTLDMRECNLRLATHTENMRNSKRKSNNKSGYKGVSWDPKTLKWIARICVNREKFALGYFTTPEKAYAAYCAAALYYHGEFARVA